MKIDIEDSELDILLHELIAVAKYLDKVNDIIDSKSIQEYKTKLLSIRQRLLDSIER